MTTNGTLNGTSNEKSNEITKNFFPLAIAAFLAVINLSCDLFYQDVTRRTHETTTESAVDTPTQSAVEAPKQPSDKQPPAAETPTPPALEAPTSPALEAPKTGLEPIAYDADSLAKLERLAEYERQNGFVIDMGSAESRIRESAGDFGGAVIAAYKELFYAFAYTGSFDSKTADEKTLTPQKIKSSLQTLKENAKKDMPDKLPAISASCDACTAYTEGRYADALPLLSHFLENTESDSFARYLAAACELETSPSPPMLSKYGAFRTRFKYLPEYWLHSARAQSDISIRLSHAEYCINTCPSGPFAPECRKMMAAAFNLQESDAPYLLTVLEIENYTLKAIRAANPELLAPLLPLLALPDNARTIYAAGVLKGICSEKIFFDYLTAERKTASGRIAERLDYILGEVS